MSRNKKAYLVAWDVVGDVVVQLGEVGDFEELVGSNELEGGLSGLVEV